MAPRSKSAAFAVTTAAPFAVVATVGIAVVGLLSFHGIALKSASFTGVLKSTSMGSSTVKRVFIEKKRLR